jgi:hypothetical protein
LSLSDILSLSKLAIMSVADVAWQERMATIGVSAKAAADGAVMPSRRRGFVEIAGMRFVTLHVVLLRRIKRVFMNQNSAAGPHADRYFVIAGNRPACG